jgi:hypothetical protein
VPFPAVNKSEVSNEMLALLARKNLQDMELRVLKVNLPLVGAGVAAWLYGFSTLSMMD